MKVYYLSLLILAALPGFSQELSSSPKASESVQLKSDTPVLVKNTEAAEKNAVDPSKETRVTAQDKILWNRPVTQNPNYLKAMPLKDPNEAVVEDKD